MKCEIDCRWCNAVKIIGNQIEWECLKEDKLSKEEIRMFINDEDCDKCKQFKKIIQVK